METLLKLFENAFGLQVVASLILILVVMLLGLAGVILYKVLIKATGFKLFGIEIVSGNTVSDLKQELTNTQTQSKEVEDLLRKEAETLKMKEFLLSKLARYVWVASPFEKEIIGFADLRDSIHLVGELWGADKTSEEGYQSLEDHWTNQPVINLCYSNITSPIVSIIDSKARELKPLTIQCTQDQTRLLSYFNKIEDFPYVTLEVR